MLACMEMYISFPTDYFQTIQVTIHKHNEFIHFFYCI